MGEFDLRTVRELIDTAFGENGNCPIDFNILGSVLYILARRLDILKRNFKLERADKIRLQKLLEQESTFLVSEIKIHTEGRKRVRRRSISGKRHLASKDYSHILPPDRLPSTDKSSSYKQHSEKMGQGFSQKRPGKSIVGSSSTEMVSTDSQFGKKSKSHKRYGEGMSTSAQRRTGQYDAGNFPPGQNRTENYDNEMLLDERRRVGKYDDDRSPFERRKAGKHDDINSPHTRRGHDDEMSTSGRHRTKTSPSRLLSPTERRSYESVLTANTKKYRDQKTGANAGSQRGGKYDGRLDFDAANAEEQHEKIYIVTRTASGREMRRLKSDEHPVATLEQFMDLVKKTRELQRKFGISNAIPTDVNDLRQPTSLTHPRTALNLSARLSAAESRLAQMLDIVTEVARKVPGIDVETAFDERFLSTDANEDYGRGDLALLSIGAPGAISHDTRTETKESQSTFDTTSYSEYDVSEEENEGPRLVTGEQLNAALQRIYDGTTTDIRKETADTFAILRVMDVDATKNEVRVHKVNKKVEELHKLQFIVDKFGDKVFDIDHRLGVETSRYQENLTRMQDDLENALDKLAEALASPKQDAVAVAQISEQFTTFQMELNNASDMQRGLLKELKLYSKSLKDIMGKIEWLRKVKTTRDDVAEAMSEKLSLKDLNGILSQAQFAATFSYFNQIARNMDYKVFSKECDWQKEIDELFARERACADLTQVESLDASLQQTFEKLNGDVDDLCDIAGPLKNGLTNKKLNRETNCLSCGMPAKGELTESNMVLWKEIAENAKSTPVLDSIQVNEINVEGICIPGRLIPHPLEQNSFICKHDCGDSAYTSNLFELAIKELHPAQITSGDTTQKETVTEGHKLCTCVNCFDIKKSHSTI